MWPHICLLMRGSAVLSGTLSPKLAQYRPLARRASAARRHQCLSLRGVTPLRCVVHRWEVMQCSQTTGMLADASRWHPGHSANTATHRVNVRIERSRAPPIGQTPSSAGLRSRSLYRIVIYRPIPRSLRSTAHGPSSTGSHAPLRPATAALSRSGPQRAPASSHGDRGRGRGWLGRRARSAYSLTAPAVKPDTMYFCRYWKSRITGIAAITEPAAKMPHGAVRASAAHMYMPTASVNWL